MPKKIATAHPAPAAKKSLPAAKPPGKPALKAPPAVKKPAAVAAKPAPAATEPAKLIVPAKPVKPPKAVKPAKPAKPAKPVKAAEPVKPAKARPQLVRDSFTMPPGDFALIAALKASAMGARRHAKKSELLRAGLRALAALDAKALVEALDRLAPVEIGRPKKSR